MSFRSHQTGLERPGHYNILQTRDFSQEGFISTERPPSFVYTRIGMIYQIPYRDCDKSYVGQTERTLLQRVKEHQWAVKTMNMDNSAL